MRGVHIFEKPCYREIRVMRGRAMRGLPVLVFLKLHLLVLLSSGDITLILSVDPIV